ncbi:MAG: O-antigen ligase family protein [Acidimicrobiales bacterium]
MNGFLRFASATNRLEVAWLALWAATISFAHRTANESLSGAIDTTHLQRIGFVAVAFLLVASTAGSLRRPRAEPLTLFLIYGVIALASVLWSASPVATAGKAAELLVAVLVVWQTARLADAPRLLLRLVDWTLLFNGVLLAVALVGYAVAPQIFSEPSRGVFRYQLAAPYMSSNAVAVLGATLAVVALARFLSLRPGDGRRGFHAVVALGFAAFPFLAQGRTGIAILAVGVSILMLRRRPSLATLIVFPAVAAVGVMMLTELATFVVRGQNVNQVETLSGRTALWDLALDGVAASPWVGYGFGVGGREAFATVGLEGFGDTISSVHNGPLEVLLGLGVLGFAVWLPAVLWGLWQAARALLADRELDLAILVVPWLARTVMSIGLGGWLDPMVGTFLAATTYFAMMRRAERVRPPPRAANFAMPRRADPRRP